MLKFTVTFKFNAEATRTYSHPLRARSLEMAQDLAAMQMARHQGVLVSVEAA